MATLRQRCVKLLDQIKHDAILRQNSSVDTLMAFVVAETGRTGDKSLEQTLPLCLYFGNEKDRDEFIALVHEVKPNMIAKKMP